MRTPTSATRRHPGTVVTLALASLSAAAGGGHVVAAAQHLGAQALTVAVFASLAVAQLGWAALVAVRGPSRPLLLAGVAGNLAASFAWAASRTVGIPLFHGGVPEAAGALDSTVVVVQVLLAATAAVAAGGGFVLAVALMATGVALLPLGAVAPPALAHGHAPGTPADHHDAPVAAGAPVAAAKSTGKVNQAAVDALLSHDDHEGKAPSYTVAGQKKKPAARTAPATKTESHPHAPGTAEHSH